MPISTHVLDTGTGRPASGVPVSLARLESGHWVRLGSAVTDRDGRCKNLFESPSELLPGIYRIRFDTAVYYERIGTEGLYPYVEVAFQTVAGQHHYHIPLLLTANSYSTYRGS